MQGKSAKPPNTASPSGERGHRTLTPQTQHNPAPGGRQGLMNKPAGRCGSSIQSWLYLQNRQSWPALNTPAWDGVGIWFAKGVSGGEESIHRGSTYIYTPAWLALPLLFSFSPLPPVSSSAPSRLSWWERDRGWTINELLKPAGNYSSWSMTQRKGRENTHRGIHNCHTKTHGLHLVFLVQVNPFSNI